MQSRPHILVVDDEIDLQEMVAENLARHGFTVHTTAVMERACERSWRCTR
jgi:DNA-binding response OmpR family regulator